MNQEVALRPKAALMGLGVPVVLLAMLSMITLPLSPVALDLLFTFNIALSMMVLLATVYSARPLDFSIFPTILLIATLLRLALNVASTRVVLLEGHTGPASAGRVIEAFGAFVVGGNYAVGLIIFAILVLINFVVVTKGAGRVSEVTARFTLDAMPGKQMAIDADLNAGVLSQEQARERREDIGRESDFYGAMDGASKFVRGDAIAGLLIVFINIIGGLVIGPAQHSLSVAEAARSYTLLTIGDGLAAQVPSLLLSTATAVIVTRVSSNQNMGEQVFGQLLSEPRALFVTASVVGLLGLVPGMPNTVFLTLAGLVAVFGWFRWRRAVDNREEDAPVATGAETADEPADFGWADVAEVDVLGLEVGYRLIPLVDRSQGGDLMSRIKGVRRKVSAELGFLIQPVHVRDDLDLPPSQYRITLNGVSVGEAEIHPGRELAINPGQVYGKPDGIATTDPSFGLEAIWISAASREEAQGMGYTVVDPSTVMATHLSTIFKRHADELLGHEDAQKLLDRLAESSPKLVEELVPKTMSLSVVVRVLRNLLEESVPIRDIRTIATTLLEQGTRSTDPDMLTTAVRQSLSRQIGFAINGNTRELPLITFDPALEQILHNAGPGSSKEPVKVEPNLAERVQKALIRTAGRIDAEGRAPVLVVPPDMRSWISRWLRPTVEGLHVLSYNEIPDNKQLRIVATLGDEVDDRSTGVAAPAPANAAEGSETR